MANSFFKKKPYPFPQTNPQQALNHRTTETEAMTDQQPHDENNAQEQANTTTNIKKELHQVPGQEQTAPEKGDSLHPIHVRSKPTPDVLIQHDTTSQTLQPLVEPQAITPSTVQTITLPDDLNQETVNPPPQVQPTATGQPQQEAQPEQTDQAQPVTQSTREPASQPLSQPMVQPTTPQMVQPTSPLAHQPTTPAHQPIQQPQAQPQVPIQPPVQGTLPAVPGHARRTRTPRQDGRKTLSAVIDQPLHARIKVAAERNGLSMIEMVEELIRRNCPEI